MTKVIVRKKQEALTDAEKYKILLAYAEGIPVHTIATQVSRDKQFISSFIQSTITSMVAIKETNVLINSTCTADINRMQGKSPAKFITTAFLALIDEQAEPYAYYFAQTGDNQFSLIQTGLDVGIARNVKKTTKDYIYRIRGQFLRDIPLVKSIIRSEQDKRIADYQIEKPLVQMELVHQVEQLKEVVVDDPRQRSNLLKAIEMLGRTIGAFTDRVEVEETDAKSGLDILMTRIKSEVKETTVYAKED
jgi:hypothetical protein